MACQLKKGLAVQSIIRGLNQLNLAGLRRTHTAALSSCRTNQLLPCLMLDRNRKVETYQPSNPKFEINTQWPSKTCSAFNKVEITDNIKPVKVIEAPKVLEFDNTVSNPLSTVIKPIKTPSVNKITIKPPDEVTEKSASKNGNTYVLKLKKRKRKLRQFKKIQAKVWPIRKKIIFLRNQKKEREILEKIDLYKREADAYDPLAEVKRNLEFVKKQGYTYDMFGPGAETFGFGVPKPEVKSLGDHLKLMKEKKKTE